jgi:hypothetical protein
MQAAQCSFHVTLLEMQATVMNAWAPLLTATFLVNQVWIRESALCDICKVVSIFTLQRRLWDYCKYIVTHNVLADVWELPPKELEDKYDERIDWLADDDITIWFDDDERPEDLLEEPLEEDSVLEERFVKEDPERTEVNSDESDDSVDDDAE